MDHGSFFIIADFGGEHLDHFWAFGAWADEGEVTGEDLPKLGNFVDAIAAKKPTDESDAGIGCLAPLGAVFFGVDAHGAEFEHREFFAETTRANLAIKDRAWGGDGDGDDGEEEDGSGENQADDGADDIEEALDLFDVDELGFSAGIEKPFGVDEFEGDILFDFLAENDQGHHRNSAVAEFTKVAGHSGAGEAFIGTEDAVDFFALDDFGELFPASEDVAWAGEVVAVIENHANELEIFATEVGEESGF